MVACERTQPVVAGRRSVHRDGLELVPWLLIPLIHARVDFVVNHTCMLPCLAVEAANAQRTKPTSSPAAATPPSGNGYAGGAPRSFDAIVVGGGHNGLTTAAYLARAGLSVCVLERREILGGGCVTEEVWPGRRVSRASYVVSLLQSAGRP